MNKSQPRKKKVLFLTTTSMNLDPIVSSIEATKEMADQIDVSHYPFDEKAYTSVDERILSVFNDLCQPDCIIYIGPVAGEFLPTPQTFNYLSSRVPVINLCCDAGCPEWHELLSLYRKEKCFTTIVNIDGNPNWPKREKDLTLWCPIDHRYYASRGHLTTRNHRLGFHGGYSSPDRRSLIEALIPKDIVTLGVRDERIGSYQAYADFMMNCKMVLNIAKTGSGKTSHFKARVLESGWAGCCLLEQKGSPAPMWLEPDKDYFEWETINDIERINRETSNEEIQYRAQNLSKTIRTRYSPKHFWSIVFRASGFEHSA